MHGFDNDKIVIMHVFKRDTDVAYCGKKIGHGLDDESIRDEGEHYLYEHERICKNCESTREYGMLLLEIT